MFHGFQLHQNLENEAAIVANIADVSDLMNRFFLCLRITRLDSTLKKGLDDFKGGRNLSRIPAIPPVRNHGVEDFVNIACGPNALRLTVENGISLGTFPLCTIQLYFCSQEAR